MLSFVCLTDKGSLISSATPEAFALYESEGRGPITSNGGEGGAFVRTRDGLEAPDVQFHIGCLLLHEEFLGVPFDDAYTFGPAVVKPTSRGQVTLRSPVPHARPRIVHNYLQTEEDRASMIAGVRLNIEITAAPALREWRRADFLVPQSDSEADIMDFVSAARTPSTTRWDLRDGLGGRRRAARPRPGGPARRRRLGHADDPARQHQRADDHGRREGRGPHPRPRSAAAREAAQEVTA